MKPEGTSASKAKARGRKKSSEPFGSWLSEAEWILAVDTATDALALALYDGHRIVAESTWPSQRLHTVELAPAVDRMLRAAGIQPADIRAVGVAEGPGSYTALRIGIAFALGFALPRSLPVIGIPTFEILVRAQPAIDKDLVAVLRAGRNRIGCCMYHSSGGKWKASGDALVLSWEELAANAPRRARICGEIDRAGKAALAKRRDLKFAPPHRNTRRAGALAEMTAERLRDPATRPMILQPIYLNSTPAGTGA
ncbi:MAG TPA: tRNA (adenosine(37)-N6)-threonylcarbamoyltransferase complex dimerization subunit type 1 TsaB [Anaerolineales bacterium]